MMIKNLVKALITISFILTCKIFESGFKMVSLFDSLIIFKCLFAIIILENSSVPVKSLNTYERINKTFVYKEKNSQSVEIDESDWVCLMCYYIDFPYKVKLISHEASLHAKHWNFKYLYFYSSLYGYDEEFDGIYAYQFKDDFVYSEVIGHLK